MGGGPPPLGFAAYRMAVNANSMTIGSSPAAVHAGGKPAHAGGGVAWWCALPTRSRDPLKAAQHRRLVSRGARPADHLTWCLPPASFAVACRHAACDVVEDNLPTISDGSSVDNVMLEPALEEGAVAGPLSADAEAAAADAGAAADVAVPDAAESDNETMGHDEADVPAPKFRKLSCSEPPPSVRVSTPAAGRAVGGQLPAPAHRRQQLRASMRSQRLLCAPFGPPSLPRPAVIPAVTQARRRAQAPLATPATSMHTMIASLLLCAPPWQSALRPELLAALEARNTTFLPSAAAGAGGPAATAAAVEDFCRRTIAEEQTEDNFYM